jgi:hypothetical protein
MTRQQLEDRLLDYLYDELDPSERAAFERALPGHPEVLREVAAHQATRKAFQTLPREEAPPGLLDDVLAEADKEAARRRRAATAGARTGFWEYLRRLLFQPAFAMAMVVLVVAGVSLVGTKKGELPGMAPATDSQSLPSQPSSVAPVAVDEAASRTEAAGLAAASDVPAAPASERRAEPAFAEAETLEAKADEAQDRDGADGTLPAKKERAPEKLAAPKTRPSDDFRARTDEWSGGGEAPEADLRAGLLAKGTESLDGSLAQDPAKELAEEPAAEETRKLVGARVESDLGTSEGPKPVTTLPQELAPPPDAARVPAAPPAKAPEPSGAPGDEAKDRGEDKRAKPEKPAEAGKTATKDVEPQPDTYRDAEDTSVTKERPPQRETQIASEKRSEPPGIDDDKGKQDAKPAPNLAPPAPSPDKLWSTYKQQAAAGAWADAARSIEALAKLEGESARVKQARAELRKRVEAGKHGGAAERLPPDPPVKPPAEPAATPPK